MLMSSTASAVTYAVVGAMPSDYAVMFIGISIVATVVGQTIITWVVQRTGHASILVIVLVAFYVIGSVATAVDIVKNILQLVKDPSQLGVRRSVCVF
jgi:di/tricarboxylate transporter